MLYALNILFDLVEDFFFVSRKHLAEELGCSVSIRLQLLQASATGSRHFINAKNTVGQWVA